MGMGERKYILNLQIGIVKVNIPSKIMLYMLSYTKITIFGIILYRDIHTCIHTVCMQYEYIPKA